jgi:hypothetical protein
MSDGGREGDPCNSTCANRYVDVKDQTLFVGAQDCLCHVLVPEKSNILR